MKLAKKNKLVFHMHSKLFNIWKCPLAKSNEIQGFIKALLIMSVLWKKIEFYKEESNHEAIELLLGALGGKGMDCEPSSVNRFFHYGSTSLP